MRKNAFTLIELLAVIVILAIIALIAVPIVLHIIEDLKKSSKEESIKMYAKAIEDGVANFLLRNPNQKEVPTIQELQQGHYINYKGNVSCEEEEIYPNGKIYLDKCTVDGTKVLYTYGEKQKKSYKKYITLVTDTGTSGLSVGDEYTYKVNATDTFTFYVLSIKGDEVNLIMDSNICNDGTIPTSSKPCLYAWHWQTQEGDEKDNRYGPDIAMINLYNGTKGWINVPDMIMDYDDENNKTDDTKGYTSIMTDETTKVTTITGKQNKTSTNQTFGNTTEPLKARLPREDEVKPSDNSLCTTSQGSCPMWLVKNLNYWNGANNKYSDNQNNGITNIYGYWLLSSYPGFSNYARIVRCRGDVNDYSTSRASYYGLRPVITVSLSDLSS